MPTYFFDIDDGRVHTADKVGVELEDITAATIEAATLAGELLKDRPRDFWNKQEWKLTVEDSSGSTLFTIVVGAIVAPAASAALPIRRKG